MLRDLVNCDFTTEEIIEQESRGVYVVDLYILNICTYIYSVCVVDLRNIISFI